MEDALTGTEKEVMRQAYENSVQYVSDIYKDIHNLLTDSFDYVFTISDHGELLGEYNLCNHNYGVYPELTHVPLQISGRDIENQTSETPVSILDIHQTIAELANVDVESRGQNLLGEIHPQPRLTEYHGLTKWLKETLQEKDVLEDYLTTSVYGVISDDGSYSYQAPESISEDLPHLDRLKTDLDVHQNRGDTEQISDEVRKQLEELGYA
jgi:arylsulfatase